MIDRTNKKIYDAFSFFNELDLLEIRLNILNDYVDYFVISEAVSTFKGELKPLYYNLNKNRFKKWHDKIIHLIIPEFPSNEAIYKKALSSPNVGDGSEHWVREFYQKEAPILALNKCSDEDIVFVSDVDEIWNPDICFEVEHDKVYRPIQTAYPHYLNNRSDQNIWFWTGTRVGTYRTLKLYGPNHFRTEQQISSIQIPNGGWHFSWTNKAQKFEAFTDGDVQSRWNAVTSTNTWKDEDQLPKYILDHKEEFVKKGLMMP